MESSEQVERRISYDIFYLGAEGYGEHMQVVGNDSKVVIEGRNKLVDWLKTSGATPLPRDIPFPSKQQAPRGAAPVDGMMKAAQQVLGAQIGRTCPIHNGPMKRIAGTTETGKLSKNGRSYPAFWVCETVEGCRGE